MSDDNLDEEVHEAEVLEGDEAASFEDRVFQCCSCKHKRRGWEPHCDRCRSFNSFKLAEDQPEDDEEDPEDPSGDEEEAEMEARPRAVNAAKVKFKRHERIMFNIEGWDGLLANPMGKPPTWGAVRGACIGVTGDPGVGKSTLVLMSMIKAADAGYRCYHADNEEPKENVIDRITRLLPLLGCSRKALKNIEINDQAELIEDVFEDAATYSPDVMTVNSLNTYYARDLNGEPIQTEAGNPTQIRRIAKLTFKFAHGKNACKKLITTFLICQVDKDGGMIGPQEVAHAVDATFIAKKGSNGDDAAEFDKTGLMMISTYNNKNRNGNARLKHRFRMDPETGILVPEGKLFM